MAIDTQATHRPRYWLITCPRTASNLLVKMLNLDHQGVRPARNGGYFFLPAAKNHFLVDEKPVDDWTEEDHTSVNSINEECWDQFQHHIRAAEQEGQVLFVKEHAIMLNHPFSESLHVHGSRGLRREAESLAVQGVNHSSRSPLNLTLLPDEFLKTWYPTFLIRHPAMMIPSIYRAHASGLEHHGFKPFKDEPVTAEVSLKWTRNLYDFYAVHFSGNSLWPIVLDADDIMTCPELVSKYAELAGLDGSKVRFSWGTVGEEELKTYSNAEKRMLSTINASTKVNTAKVAGRINISEEVVKWKNEFGVEVAQKLEQWVRSAMLDYNYLHSKRLQLE